ncbi:MAG: EAL domain-containing protein [Pseudomonadota bacterium]
MTNVSDANLDATFDETVAALKGISDLDASTDFETLSRVKDAILEGRIELYLQPIVSLPQRKPRFYEAFSRLRDADGDILKPASYIEAAERANRIGVIDNLILTRCVDAIRRRSRVDPHLVVFCNISPATLFDSEFFAQFTSFLEANADIAGNLVFEFTYPSIHMMHPRVERNIAEIAARGFAFSVDHMHCIDLDWESLRARNFRFVKASARMLLGAESAPRDDVADARFRLLRDFRSRVRDCGIDVIAEKIEREADMPGILSIGLDYGQGHLFGAPRPADHYLSALRPVEV